MCRIFNQLPINLTLPHKILREDLSLPKSSSNLANTIRRIHDPIGIPTIDNTIPFNIPPHSAVIIPIKLGDVSLFACDITVSYRNQRIATIFSLGRKCILSTDLQNTLEFSH
jgi:hypothetical protein